MFGDSEFHSLIIYCTLDDVCGWGLFKVLSCSQMALWSKYFLRYSTNEEKI